MKDIKKAAVLGSGVMGSGIAALLANAGVEVLLLDIVPKDATDRNMLAKGAIDKQLKAKPASGFTLPKNARRVTPGNLEDDLEKLKDCDWVVEVVLERLDVKHDVYRKILPYLKPDAVLSTNTSTIPLAELEKGMPEELKHRFLLTHFFNPPRFLPLLEVTGGKDCDPAIVEEMKEFADIRLGKGVVMCKDTPGFLGNRIGVYWLIQGLLKAMELGISVEDADAVMGKPVGIPKTGVFGLFDLIGIDLMPHIAKSMLATLPKEDRFCEIYREPELIKKLIAEGYTGRKGKGGFYRMNTEGGKKVKEAIDLATGEYHKEKKSTLKSVDAARAGLAALVSYPDIGGRYAKAVLTETLWYAASLIPEISDDILGIDDAMKLGYNWKYGPFELIDRLSTKDMAGADVLAAACVEAGLDVPEILQVAAGKSFYKEEGSRKYYLTMSGEYAALEAPKGAWLLKDKTRGAQPVKKNASAAMWDLGDGVLGFEFKSKGNTFDPEVMAMLRSSHDLVKEGFKGLVIGHDGEHFSFGANLGFFMYVANLAAWPMLSDVIREGQQTFYGLKYAPFPVVGAPAGMALGGGCEILLHCDAVQSHMELYAGLVEAGVGVIPGWGGCKEMLMRGAAAQESGIKNLESRKENLPDSLLPQGSMPVISKAFEQIGMAKVSTSAEEAREMMILNPVSGITMNRRRVLADAKALCLKLAQGYTPPQPRTIRLPGATAKTALLMALDGFKAQGKATPHDLVVGEHLATVLSGGDTDITQELTEQNLLDLEHDVFMELVKTEGTLARIEHMLETNKPLRN